MKVFVFNPEVDEKIKAIMHLINLRKSGEVANLISNSYNDYRVSYGVSLNYLKEISSIYQKDNQLAEQLWYKEIRETMIMATMIADPGSISEKVLIEWTELIKASELAEQFAKNILSKSEYLKDVCSYLLKKEMPITSIICFFAIGWALRDKTIGAGAFMAGVVQQLESLHLNAGSNYYRSVSYLLRQMVRRSAEGRIMIEQWMDNRKKGDDYGCNLVLEEVRTELDYWPK